MNELFEQIEKIALGEGRAALATLVNTRGTTPRKEGAKMLVGAGGRILGSVTIGGCVDARVIEESTAVLGGDAPRLLELHLGDEDAWEIGLTCGGTIEVFLEPLVPGRSGDLTLAFYERLRSHALEGGRGALVTRLDPPHHGAKLMVLDSGSVEGTLGDPSLDRRSAALAREALARGASETLSVEGVRVFVESFIQPPVLVIVGAGHVAIPLASMAKTLGFRTVIVDGRPRFANRERFPGADEIRVGIPSEIVSAIPMISSTALVLVAHDYKYDLPVLRHAIGTNVGYVGLLGSRRRGSAILDLLREEGFAEEQIARVRVPVGLDLGGNTAPEIALSILAEILAVKNGATGLPLSEKAGRAIR